MVIDDRTLQKDEEEKYVEEAFSPELKGIFCVATFS